MTARVIPWPKVSMPDLSEALDAVDLLEEALVQALDDRVPTGLQIAALAVWRACGKSTAASPASSRR